MEALQAEFVRLVAAEGWPASGGQVALERPGVLEGGGAGLEAGERVAYFLVDSLRYELGVEIEKQLSDKLQVTLQTVCAQLPTYTEVGMASLMPDAESALKLVAKRRQAGDDLGWQCGDYAGDTLCLPAVPQGRSVRRHRTGGADPPEEDRRCRTR